jgi:enterochelin esterase-like enzyme
MRGRVPHRSTARRRRIVAIGIVALLAVAFLEIFVGPADERARHGASVEHITINSKAVGQKLEANVVTPDGGGDGRPMLIFLHGRGARGAPGVPSGLYDALHAAGKRSPVVVFPYGGDHSYWHNRSDGKWGDYVLDEVIPAAAKASGADSSRVAIGGESMGGFGALNLAAQNPGRFCAAAGHSPALWSSASETAAGAFDDAADFERNDVIGAARAGAFGDTPIWVDAGDQDPFLPWIREFTAVMDSQGSPFQSHIWPGGHGGDYWNSHWDDYIGFYSRALARCKS